jgi:RIO kinase 1
MSHDFSLDPQPPSFPDNVIRDAHRFVQAGDLSDIDARFIVDFQSYDDPEDGQRWSTWLSVEPLARGPEPRPDWVVTSQGAVDTELGILKTGKEAHVHLLERADPHDPGSGVVMAAKR